MKLLSILDCGVKELKKEWLTPDATDQELIDKFELNGSILFDKEDYWGDGGEYSFYCGPAFGSKYHPGLSDTVSIYDYIETLTKELGLTRRDIMIADSENTHTIYTGSEERALEIYNSIRDRMVKDGWDLLKDD